MSETTKYLEIADKIKQKIISNIYKPNELLPSEKQLFLEYNVSRRTIRHSIMKLVEDGFLYTVSGKGTFVHMRADNKYTASLNMPDIITAGFDTARLFSAKIQNPDINQVYNLQVAPSEKVLCIEWLLLRDEQVIAYDIKTIPYFSGIPIGESDLGYTTLREILITKFSQYELKENVRVSALTADEKLCEIMQLKTEQPVVVMDIKIFDTDMMPLGWNKLYIKAEEWECRGEMVL